MLCRTFRTLYRSIGICCLTIPLAWGNPDTATEKGTKAAVSWLEFVDEGAFEKSWQHLHPSLKSEVGEIAWKGMLTQVHDAMGQSTSRTRVGAKYTQQLPEAPPGEYVVVQYETRFKMGTMIETVVPRKGSDGRWRVSGYFVRQDPQAK